MKLYLLYYDTDSGAREEWSVFYTPCEIFLTPEQRQARIDFIRQQVDEDGNPVNYVYELHEHEVMTDTQITEWNNGL
jgi:hypothetical protein